MYGYGRNFNLPPSGSITNIFANKQDQNVDKILSQQEQSKTPNQIQVETKNSTEEYKKINTEFENLIKEKLGKIDEILISIKEKQNLQIQTQQTQQITPSVPLPPQQQPNHMFYTQIPMNNPLTSFNTQAFNSATPQGIISEVKEVKEKDTKVEVKSTEKKKGKKSTYYPITDNMWIDLKEKYHDLPDNHRSKVVSDGEQYYIQIKNKKILLDGKGLLKLLNTKE